LLPIRNAIQARVLRRRLHADGTSIRQLIGAARFEVACQLLGETLQTLAEIASAVGYSGAAAFCWAFRNWTNTTPSAWQSLVETAPMRAVRTVSRRTTR
jgi:AraC-like DNA-binding protein